MQQSSLHKVRTVSATVRNALEQLLGRALSDNEAISVRTYQPHEAPSPEQQRAIAEELRQYFAKIDERTKDIPESEQEEIVDEAIRSVRPRLPVLRVRVTLDSTILVRANQRATGLARALLLVEFSTTLDCQNVLL